MRPSRARRRRGVAAGVAGGDGRAGHRGVGALPARGDAGAARAQDRDAAGRAGQPAGDPGGPDARRLAVPGPGLRRGPADDGAPAAARRLGPPAGRRRRASPSTLPRSRSRRSPCRRPSTTPPAGFSASGWTSRDRRLGQQRRLSEAPAPPRRAARRPGPSPGSSPAGITSWPRGSPTPRTPATRPIPSPTAADDAVAIPVDQTATPGGIAAVLDRPGGLLPRRVVPGHARGVDLGHHGRRRHPARPGRVANSVTITTPAASTDDGATVRVKVTRAMTRPGHADGDGASRSSRWSSPAS